MAYRRKCGMGATCAAQSASIFSGELWDYIFHGCPVPSAVAAPPAPTGSVLTVPPASEGDAQQTVDALLNQQMRDQQAKNAEGVKSTWWDETLGGAYGAGNTLGDSLMAAFPWILGGVAVLALVAVGGGSPRRYGR